MREQFTLLGVVVGIAVGFPVGMVYAVTRRAWRDLRRTKDRVSRLRSSAWSLTTGMVAWAALTIGVLFVAATACVPAPH
jgi:hypothetical protein